jgi:hypothetical protein
MFENPIDKALDVATSIHNKLADSKPGAAYRELRSRAPILEEREILTPFGRVKTPEFSPPDLQAIHLDDRKREAYKATLAIDVSIPVSFIPVVGDFVADVIEDVYSEKLRDTLTQNESKKYAKFDKANLSTLALTKAFWES